ncbi:MAG: alpha-2-macroglobulin family protein [Alphaproteobacteria bacterium]|nr:alpha-2-macroglobulin family protein [Alphaproteobacteria bacterium]
MRRTSAVIAAAAVLGAFAAGLGVGRFLIPGNDLSVFSREASSSDVRAQTERRLDFQTPRAANAPRPEAPSQKGFGYTRLLLDTSGDAPKACFQFSERLDTSGKTNYADYVRVSPQTKPVVRVDGQSLCISGLAFDKDYRATLRAGLPSASGEMLERPQDVTVSFGDKPAYVGFAGEGVVLPRREADGLGIETVNVEKIRIEVKRISDRALARKEVVKGASVAESDYYYVYGDESGEDVGVTVYKGDLEIDSERNQTETTVFALGAALKDLKPGAYFVHVKDVSPGADKHRAAQAWRWVMFTDIALTTYSSSEGIDVFANAISTARPMAGLRIDLIASNNDLLATTKTNADGRAHFDGAVVNGDYPLTPRMIMAYGADEDFAALDLQRAPLDLSDRDVGGRDATPKADAFVYFDRGIYRPGETAHITGLLRDDAGRAVENRPLTVKILRPNNTEAEKKRFDKTLIGAFSFDYDVPSSAPRGVWRVEVDADGVGKVGSETFSVEDFVPQRLDVELDVDAKTPLRPGETRTVGVSSRFLYGAPASGLSVEAEARLRLDPNPFPALRGYRFGPVDGRFDERFLKLPNTSLDQDGNASIALNIDDAPKGAGAPLRADLVIGVVEPGGRVVRESARIPVRPDDRYVGLKLESDGGGVGVGDPATIDAVLLGWDGEQIEGDLEWRLVEEDYWFDWYRENGEWRWRRSYKDVLIGEGKTNASSNGSAKITQSLEAGSYRLQVTDPKSGARSEIRFYVGWRSYAAGAESPDQASITGPTEPIRPGAKAHFFINPPYAGEAIIVVATDKVQSVQRVKVGEEGREISIETDPSWGPGFYVLATVITPRDPANRPVPRRAMAVAYAPFNMSARKLDVSIKTPEILRPRQTVNLPVTIHNAKPDETVMLTLAAVDEGILRLTKFPSPDPVGFYYGKKRLGVEVRDDYGRMLDPNLGAPAKFGGDQIGGEGLTVVPTKSVALFEGPVKVGADGKASVSVVVPDFNGELRLMAVAWSVDQLGSMSGPLTVRDPVPAELAMSRFLAPGDRAEATLLIDNVDGEDGDYKVTITGEGPASINQTQIFALKKGQKRTERYVLTAGATGVGAVKLNVTGPGGFHVSRSYPIEVRTPYFPVTTTSSAQLKPGDSYVADASLLAPFAPASANITVSFSRLKGVEPGPLLEALSRYPYGCTEQLVSSAMPLLYIDVLAGETGQGPERAVRPRVQKAINDLLNRQGSDGAFGLWREGDGWASPWLGAYVTDFLFRAKQAGYAVPDEALDKAYDALAQVTKVGSWVSVGYQMGIYSWPGSQDTKDLLRRRAAAYALYVLARAGRADLSDLRYFHDAMFDSTPSPLARAQVSAALLLMGDRARSTDGFAKAIAAIGYQNNGDYYQTPLRDVAGVLALAAEAGRNDLVEEVAVKFSAMMREPSQLQTQEKAFILLASHALLKNAGPMALSQNDVALKNLAPAPSFSPRISELRDSIKYTNTGEGPIFRNVTVSGAPKTAPPPVSNGFTIAKQFETRDGAPVDLSAVRQNERIVVVLSGATQDKRLHPAVIADLLPAGFEIEAVLNPEDADMPGDNDGPYKWIGEISRAKVAEARDDRFVAAIDLQDARFKLAYIVRAVTPGAFVAPGAVIEDMYRPGITGRTDVQRLTISPAQ